MPDKTSITLCATDEDLRHHALLMANRLNGHLLESCSETLNLPALLVVSHDSQSGYRWELHFPTEKLSPVFVDFNNERLLYRLKFGGGRQQAIARALGLKKGNSPIVIDATAGLGRDAFILSSLGCRVHMLERNPVIHALLEDGLRRLALTGHANERIVRDLHLTHSDGSVWLKETSQSIDIVYLDPMYPHRSKSALVKKEMRVLRKLVGDDSDVNTLLEVALDVARQRVVVKRPKAAPPIASMAPHHCIESKNTRYDVYLTHVQ